MSRFSTIVENGIVTIAFDQGRLNTLSRQAIEELGEVVTRIHDKHAREYYKGVILTGNGYGLGAGADINELMHATRDSLAALIDKGHEVLFAIEEGPIPWVALVDGVALGGLYEVALACHAIIATERSRVGFPEIQLNIFPGLGGTQRMPRRSGLVNPNDPARGNAGFTVILGGKSLSAREALAINMIDAIVPDGADPHAYTVQFLKETFPSLTRTTPPDLAQAEMLKPMVLPMVEKATGGKPNPRAPYVALEVIVQGATLPLRDAIKLERDAFLEVATSSEGKAGMRFFFAQQKVEKLPRELAKVPQREIRRVGVAGAGGYMGSAIAFLALRAGYEVVGHEVPEAAPHVIQRIGKLYDPLLTRKRITSEDALKEVKRIRRVETNVEELADCDLVIEVIKEDENFKADFYRKLGAPARPETIVCSNSSSMGPGFLTPFFAENGGNPANMVNLHFFSPAEHPSRALVEVVRGEHTSPEVLATAHSFVRKIRKIPVILKDGSPGFLVNAALAEYLRAAELLYRSGTPIEEIDAAMREIFPVGPFELVDDAGVDVAAGMFDVLAKTQAPFEKPLVTTLRDLGRFGVKSGGGFYEYQSGKRGSVWPELEVHAGLRGTHHVEKDLIIEQCLKALARKAKELCDQKIVGSEEECDLAFIYGIGFPMYLGGPIFYARQREWF